MFRFLAITAFGLLHFGAVDEAKAQSATSLPAPAAIDAIFKEYDSQTSPGCSVAVIDDGTVVFKKSYGMADPSLGVPMTSSTTMWIPYSETRIFLALAVGMLSRDGKIDLDDPVRTHVEQVPEYANQVTVRHLLHHTSGLVDYGSLAGPGYDLGDRMSEDEFFRLIYRWGNLGSEPGRAEQYSNTDYALLKILVERVSGMSLDDYLAERIFEPLGMNATRVGFEQAKVVANHALFYDSGVEGLHKVLRYRVSPVGGIAITTSLDDIVRWDKALREGALGIPALLEDLKPGALSPMTAEGDEGLLFGIYKGSHKGVPLTEYRGVGEYKYLVHVPGRNLSVATLCNSYQGMWNFGPDIAVLYVGSETTELQDLASAPQPLLPLPAIPSDVSPVPVPLSELKSLVGDYVGPSGKLNAVDVALVDGKLILRPRGSPAFPALRPMGNNQFMTAFGEEAVRIDFKQEGDETVLSVWDVAANEPGADDLRRISTWRPTEEDLSSYSGMYVGDKVDITLFVRADGHLLLMAGSGYEETWLTPQAERDEFRLPAIYWAKFERNESGRVVAMTLDAVRVKGIRLSRRE